MRLWILTEPFLKKTNNLGIRQGPTQTSMYSQRSRLETWNSGFKRKRNCAILLVKTKSLISFTVTAKLICSFVFAYADCWFSDDPLTFIATCIVVNNSRRFSDLSTALAIHMKCSGSYFGSEISREKITLSTEIGEIFLYNFNKFLAKKKKKSESLTISPENNSCMLLYFSIFKAHVFYAGTY